jgi:integrase
MEVQEVSFERALTRWLVVQRAGKARSTRHFYWETIKQIRKALRARLSLPIHELGDNDIALFAERAGHYCVSRWNAMLQVLHAVWPLSQSLKRRTPLLTRRPPPTQEEFRTLLAEADRLPKSKAGLVIAFLAHSGLRISAARSVQWSDVHTDRIEYIAKGGRRCSVPIIAGMEQVLTRLRTVTGGTGHVLPQIDVKIGIKSACLKAGLRPLSHHDFRHMFATRCISSGVDVPTTARWLGHRDGGALLTKRYFHLLDEHSRAMAMRVRIAA